MAAGSFAGELFARAGLSYEAVDISPYPRTMAIDLNRGRLPFWKRGRYELVTNCGTTEHVINQLNAFRLIHDACKVGGLMYHGVPMAGDFSHGFVSYHPKFFTRLQEVNGYEIIARWIWADARHAPVIRSSRHTSAAPSLHRTPGYISCSVGSGRTPSWCRLILSRIICGSGS